MSDLVLRPTHMPHAEIVLTNEADVTLARLVDAFRRLVRDIPLDEVYVSQRSTSDAGYVAIPAKYWQQGCRLEIHGQDVNYAVQSRALRTTRGEYVMFRAELLPRPSGATPPGAPG